jgi:hypothetical protein
VTPLLAENNQVLAGFLSATGYYRKARRNAKFARFSRGDDMILPEGIFMSLVVFIVVIAFLALGVFGCRLMPFEIGSRILPNSLSRILYGGRIHQTSKAPDHPLSN